ncbi:MAG: hypothetical protein RL148_376 [Planctomycetota bacterium]|jgi:exosortase
MTGLPWMLFPLVAAYATAVWWCVESWFQPDGYWAHGPLVPLLVAILWWARRGQLAGLPAALDPRGWWLLGPALLLHLCGAALTIDSLSAASMLLAVPGIVWLAQGVARLRVLAPVLGLLVFAVPLPMFVSGRVAFELKELAIGLGTGLANALGLGVTRDGALLLVDGQPGSLLVAAPCGGLRSLISMLLIAYCVALFLGPRTTGRTVLLLCAAAPVALLVNVVRIAATCGVASRWGVEVAAGDAHDLLNVGAWVLDLGVMMVLSELPGGRLETSATAVASSPAVRDRTGLLFHGGLLAVLAMPLLLLSLHRPFAESQPRAGGLPDAFGPFVLREAREIDPSFQSLLGTKDAAWRVYGEKDGPPVFVVAVFHESNWKSVHPPHICLEGGDMEIGSDRQVELLVDGSPSRVGLIVAHPRGGAREYVSVHAFVSRELTTGSYLDFFLHHAPRALFRHSNAGALLRVETYVEPGEDVKAARQRCGELLGRMLPVVKGMLP